MLETFIWLKIQGFKLLNGSVIFSLVVDNQKNNYLSGKKILIS